MSKQILEVAKAVSYEMDVDKEVIFQAIENALETVTKKQSLADMDVRVQINRETGDYETFRCWTVVDENDETIEFNAEKHLILEAAKKRDENLEIGSVIEEPIKSVEFGRIAAQAAKQVIMKKVKEAKRAKTIDAYRSKLNTLVSGVAKKVERAGVTLDLPNNAEAFIPRDQMIAGEAIRNGDRVRAYLYEISEGRGPQLLCSRASKEMLRELLTIEVPEIGEGVIEIKAMARDPGSRAKVAVKSFDGRIDPIGACVGMRGSRIQVISNELNGERIDIILWDDNPAQLVINALAPAEVASIVVDEDKKTMNIAVDKEQLAQAIGRSGQNIRLASKLSGWELNVMSMEDAEKQTEKEAEKAKQMFMEKLDIDEDIAEIFIREGFATVDEIAYAPEVANIEEFDEDIIAALRERAKKVLDKEEAEHRPADDLLKMKGMSELFAYELAEKGIKTMEDLAEQSIDDLMGIAGMTREKAGELIMTAREPWFK
jgi:N utilization substance protein A